MNAFFKTIFRYVFNMKLIGLLLFAGVLLSIDFHKLITVLKDAHWLWCVAALLLQVPVIFIKSYRWKLFLNRQDVEASVTDLFVMYLVSVFYGTATPGRAGEFWKSIALKKRHNIPLATSLPSTILDRVMDFYFYLICGLSFAFVLGIFPGGRLLFYPVLAVAIVCPFIFMKTEFVRKLSSWIFLNRVSRKLSIDNEASAQRFETSCLALVSPVLIPAGLITLCSGFILFFQFWIFMLTVNIQTSFWMAVMVASLLKFLSNVPITVLGIGTRDVALVFLFHLTGLPPEKAVGLSMIVLLVNQIGICLLGLAASFFIDLEKTENEQKLNCAT